MDNPAPLSIRDAQVPQGETNPHIPGEVLDMRNTTLCSGFPEAWAHAINARMRGIGLVSCTMGLLCSSTRHGTHSI